MAISEFFAEIYHGRAALVGPFLPFGTENAEGQLKKKTSCINIYVTNPVNITLMYENTILVAT